MSDFTVGVIGVGAFGTAIAQTFARSGHHVLCWAREKEVVKSINKNHVNPLYLSDIKLDEKIKATKTIEEVAQKAKVLIVSVPAFANTEIATQLNKYITTDHTVILCVKGFRESDGALMSEVWQESVKNLGRFGVMSGPSYSRDLALGKPTSVVLASHNKDVIEQLDHMITDPYFRMYFSDDVTGVQIAGALKNVVAVAAGLNDGLGWGANCKALIVNRGLIEMARYVQAMGGRLETVVGLTGMGDLYLSTVETSRNYRLGKALGEGRTLEEALEHIDGYAESVKTARIVTHESINRGIDLAVIMAIDGVFNGDIAGETVMQLLFHRPRKWETTI